MLIDCLCLCLAFALTLLQCDGYEVFIVLLCVLETELHHMPIGVWIW